MIQTFERCKIWRSVIVGIGDVERFMTDVKTYREATNAYLLNREEDWDSRFPRPTEGRFLLEWHSRRLDDLYPDKYYEIDGKEITEAQALNTGITTWDIKVRILFDQDLANKLDKEIIEEKNKINK